MGHVLSSEAAPAIFTPLGTSVSLLKKLVRKNRFFLPSASALAHASPRPILLRRHGSFSPGCFFFREGYLEAEYGSPMPGACSLPFDVRIWLTRSVSVHSPSFFPPHLSAIFPTRLFSPRPPRQRRYSFLRSAEDNCTSFCVVAFLPPLFPADVVDPLFQWCLYFFLSRRAIAPFRK